MINFAKVLCHDFYLVRVDFYNVSGKIYFGEIIFTSESGSSEITPPEYNEILGNLIKLPTDEQN